MTNRYTTKHLFDGQHGDLVIIRKQLLQSGKKLFAYQTPCKELRYDL